MNEIKNTYDLFVELQFSSSLPSTQFITPIEKCRKMQC